ncbi:PREDICTED: uncharacterized protein LOC109466062 [Branchiostoma belcheri]|uniref:Leucine-rich repeat protein SHOC-2 n=1 Tax=Branchiostoma belcheri TaxID=7741 RepID=A0A6P4Y4B8_BRABE|nr:PREDICTED: uncharacterized protein LOC109466062 [Branchiostoma belcheri]
MDRARKATRRSPREKGTNRREGNRWTEANLRARMQTIGSSKDLDLSHKRLKEIPPAVFSITELDILDVSDNPLGSLPVNIASLHNLKEVRAAGCDVSEVSGNISRCAYLTRIDLSRNPRLASLPPTMKQLRYLKHVALSSCELTSLPENLTLLATVETLDLSQNQLTSLPPGIAALTRVKVLIISDNAFGTIPESIESLGRLDRLEMKRNKLNNSSGDLKLNVPAHLKALDMEGNYSLKVLPEGLERLEKLEELNMSYCGLETLPESVGKLSSIRRLHLAGNKLRVLPASLGNLLRLQTLDLEGNRRLSDLPLTLYQLRDSLRDKQAGTNTGLILDNCPALALPEAEVLQGNVVSVLVDLLSEDILHKTSVRVAAEVVDETIVEGLTDNMVAVTEECVWDDLMLDVAGVVIADKECSEYVFRSMLEEVLPGLMKEITVESIDEETAMAIVAGELLEETASSMTEELATDAVQVDDAARAAMEELLESGIKATATEVATGAMQLDAASWNVMEEFMEEAETLMLKEVAESAVQVDNVAREILDDILGEVTEAITDEMAARAAQVDAAAWEELEELSREVTEAVSKKVAARAVRLDVVAWEVMQGLLEEVPAAMTEDLATHAAQVDAMTWRVMGEMLEEVRMVMTEEMATAAVQVDNVAWEVLENMLEEVMEPITTEAAVSGAQLDDVAWGVLQELLEEVTEALTTEVATHAARVDAMTWEVVAEMWEEAIEEVAAGEVRLDATLRGVAETLMKEATRAMAKSVASEEHAIWHLAMDVMEGLLDRISKATARSVALEVYEESRLGQTVPDEYNKQTSHWVSGAARAVQYLSLPAGGVLAIPPRATGDTSVISAVLNPHGCGQTIALRDDELLVSDVLQLRPAGLRFSQPVTLTLTHALPRFHLEKQYVVKTSGNGGRTWQTLNTRSQKNEWGQHVVTVDVSHFSEFAVVARPLERYQASPLRSSSQTDVLISLPRDFGGHRSVGYTVLPVDADTLTCAAMKDGIREVRGMSHIVRFCKNLLLSSPATVVLPLAPGNARVRVISYDDVTKRWHDVTSSVDDLVIQGSKVAFKTDQLRAGFAVVCDNSLDDPTRTVEMVTKNTRARLVQIVILKKWQDARRDGVMTARIECVHTERAEDRVCQAQLREDFECQEGTPTPTIVLLEGEDICCVFEGQIRPEEKINGHHGVNFTFYCERPRVLEFHARLASGGRGATSRVRVYPGRLERLPYRPPTPPPTPPIQVHRAPVPQQQTYTGPAVPRPQPAPPPPVRWPKLLASAEITPPTLW